MSRPTKSAVLVAEICLYGTAQAGSGWIACSADGTKSGKLFGNGDPSPGRSMTETVWLAADELRTAGVTRGTVRIFMSGGDLCADVEIGRHIPYFGELRWQRAPVYAISAEHARACAEARP